MIRHLSMSVSYTTPDPRDEPGLGLTTDPTEWAPDARHFEYAVAMSDESIASFAGDPYGFLRLIHRLMLREAAIAIGGGTTDSEHSYGGQVPYPWADEYVRLHATWEVIVPKPPKAKRVKKKADAPKPMGRPRKYCGSRTWFEYAYPDDHKDTRAKCLECGWVGTVKFTTSARGSEGRLPQHTPGPDGMTAADARAEARTPMPAARPDPPIVYAEPTTAFSCPHEMNPRPTVDTKHTVAMNPERPNTRMAWDTACRVHWPETCGTFFIPSDEPLDIVVTRKPAMVVVDEVADFGPEDFDRALAAMNDPKVYATGGPDVH